jgi:hypothetical protein
MIGGFVIAAPSPKRVIVLAKGRHFPIRNQQRLAEPTLQLVRLSDQQPSRSTTTGATRPMPAIRQSGSRRQCARIGGPHDAGPRAYTAIVAGKDNVTGVGIFEVYEIDAPSRPCQHLDAWQDRHAVATR